MSRKRRRSAPSSGESGRRGFLLKLGGGAALLAGGGAALLPSGAFSLVNAGRNSPIGVASSGNAVVGIVGQGPVKKNTREPMIQFTNNTTETVTITVTLDNGGDGTLYDNEGGSGSTVTFTLISGNSQFVDITASATGAVGYSVSVTSAGGLILDTTGSVESQSGNVAGAVRIQAPKKDQDFAAVLPGNGNQGNVFEIKKVDIRDDDNTTPDADLDRIEFRVREGGSAGTVVGSLDVTSFSDPDRYNPNGNPAVTIQPNSGDTIKANTTYSLTVTGFDADGNFESSTVEDTT